MSVLSENELNELAAKTLEAKGIDDLHTAYDWCKNAEMVLVKNARRLGEDTTPESLQNYVRNSIRTSINDLSRFSPYEMGVFYLEAQGAYHPSSKRSQDIFAEKFGLTSPSEIHGGLLRTIRFGDVIRQDFARQFSDMGLRPAPKAQSALREIYANPLDDLPWLKPGMPDLLQDATGKIWMVTYKIPGSQEQFENMVASPPDHTYAEVAQTLIALEKKGIIPDHVVLAPYSIADMEIMPVRMTVSDDLKSKIISIGNKMYNEHLMTMQMPQWEKSDNFHIMDEAHIDAESKALSARYTLVNTLKNLADKEAKTLRSRLDSIAEERFAIPRDMEGKKRMGQMLQIDQTLDKGLDYKKVAGWLIEKHDCAIEDLSLSGSKLDNSIIDVVLKNLGLTEEAASLFEIVKPKRTFRIPGKSEYKASAENMLKEMIKETSDLFDEIHGLSKAEDQAPKIGTSKGMDPEEIRKEQKAAKEKELEEDSTLGLGF